jgi:hypothetical protein
MSGFPVFFLGQFMTPLPEKEVQEQKIIINIHFHFEFDGWSNASKVVK